MKRRYQIFVLAILVLSVLSISCSDLKRNTSAPTSSVSEIYSPYNCNACHGNETNAAPPRDLQGNTSTSSPGVGAHQSHLLADDGISLPVACNECHLVPHAYNSPGHLDTTPGAEVLFQGTITKSRFSHIAGADTASRYVRGTLTCQNTYCHGNFPSGNKAAPIWNDQSGAYAACGSCHGDLTKSTIGDRALPKTVLNGGSHLSVQQYANITQC
jgi:predicted CxxxxCH...CXXCH cytochrome family protein